MKKKTNASPLLAKMLAASSKQKTPLAQPTTASSQSKNLHAEQLHAATKLHEVGKLDEASVIYLQLLADATTSAIHRARALTLLGTVHLQQSKFEQAGKLFEEALLLNPKDASTHNNFGVTLKQSGKKDVALAYFEEAVRLNPKYADSLNNLGAALIDARKLDTAIDYLDRAIALKPDFADAHYNRGTAYQSMNLFEEAEASFQRALQVNPNYTSALFNSGLLRLLRGEFEQGWRLYEYRWQDEQAKKYVRNFTQPLWQGDADLTGKTIFLYAEQGLGDFIQFCRYISMVEPLAGKVIVLVPQALMSLVSSLALSFKVTFLPRYGDTTTTVDCEFDYHCPILSLPLAFNTRLESIPAQVPYLAAPEIKNTEWKSKLGDKKSPRIGLVWSGAAGHLNDFNRSITFASLAAILPTNADYHILQKEIRQSDSNDITQLMFTHNIFIHCDALNDFTDTAALINQMDLVISVDTSVAHLAGALAKPLWILIPFFPDFRWLLDRDDSPWYPTTKLFRQDKMGDWSNTLQKLKNSLVAFLDEKNTPPLVLNNEIIRAHINHGLSLHHANKLSEALGIYSQILESDPNNTEVLTLVASLYLQQKNLEQSQRVFEQSLALDSNNILTLHNYALLLEKLDRNDEAIQYLDKALHLNPAYEDAYKHKANILKKLGLTDAAIDLYQTAVEKLPQSADMHFRLANELRDIGRTAAALEEMNQAIRCNKDFALAYNNRGNIYLDMKQPLEAIKNYQQALAINPNYANAYNNSANAYLALNQYEDAITACDAALAIDPKLLTTLNNRANALQKLKRFDEAMQAYDHIIAEHDQYSFAPLNKGLLCLLQGNFAEGWPLYEARWHAAPQPKLLEVFRQPLWLGEESLSGKTILLHAEQGYGDSIQFCRYAALALAAGAALVYLNVPKLLFKLVQESFSQIPATSSIKVLTDGDTIPKFDYQCPMMSLPLAFKTDITSIPANIPYLFSNKKLGKKWRDVLGKKTKPRVGIVWSGSSAYSNDSNRSIPMSLLAALFNLDIEFHSLQKEIKPEDEAFFKTTAIHSHQELLTDFSQTAALIEEMDLVISVDTSVAHLAGALGKPVWILLPFVPDFRWMLDRSDSPWYPTAQLFRQIKSGNWQTVVQQLIHALNARFNLASEAAVSYNNQGNALANQGLLHEAIAMYELEISLNPNNALAHNNLGSALQRLGQHTVALRSFDTAIALAEHYVSPRLNKAILQLTLGELSEGWSLYEWRWKNDQWRDAYRTFAQPLWTDTTSLKGKTIFIYPEQGLGDYIQLSRYFSMLLQTGAHVIAEVPASLATLMRDSFAHIQWHEAGNTDAFNTLQFDYQCPIFSLPLAFNTTLDNIPATDAYLSINKDKQKTWQESLPAKTKPRIGIVWTGASAHRNDQNRSITTNEIMGLLQQGYEFHVLQKELSKQDLISMNMLKQFGSPIFLYSDRLNDFSDTAALINEMDLVISVDTSVAHLAGAFGKPVWILLPELPDFRWLLNRQDSPWYPSARLFRQEKNGDWKTVLSKVTDALKSQFKR